MTVGGGIRSLNDARDLLVCGADKVSLNTGATSNPALIDEIALQFGSQACVISIETIKIDGQWRVMTDNGRNYTGRNALDWAYEVADRGAGELLITSIHNDGVGKGLDLDLINQICARVDVPVVASGGVGNACHVGELLDNTPASAVAIAQALHWNRVSLNDLRSALNKRGYFVRPI
jgi:cyclase